MKNDTILFRLVWSDRILTKREKDELLKRDPGAGLFLHPVDASPKYFEYKGSDELHSLDKIQAVIRDNPSALWTAHEVKVPRRNRKNNEIHQLGKMDGKTALSKFG
jgi:hypothetical protein